MGRLSRRPFGGRTFLADTSAWTWAGRPLVRLRWSQALQNGQVVTSPLVKIELLRSARDGDEFDERDDHLSDLHELPLTRSVTNAALRAFRELAHRGPLHQRSVTLPDLLIAASAQDAAVGVLHYDAHFDILASVLRFESRWIAPRGSLD